MRRKIFVAIVAAACLVTTGANAQLGGMLGKALFGMPANGEAGGTYQSDNQIRTFISARPYSGIDLYGKIIVKAGEMTRDKGFSRFGVTKHECSTMLMNGSPIASSCYVIAIMLNADDQAKPRGKREVQYYNVDDVLAGTAARPAP